MDLSQKMRKEEYLRYLEDVSIAVSELTNMKLYPVEGNMVCDLYAIPSHNFQSYYAIIYEQDGKYNMVYAKPQLYDPVLQMNIKMYRFKDAKEVENHPAKNGKIIMGIKHLTNEFVESLTDLVSSILTVRINDGGIVLDGYFQAIRVYENNEVYKELAFKYGDEVVFREGKEYLSKVLDDFYISINEIL